MPAKSQLPLERMVPSCLLYFFLHSYLPSFLSSFLPSNVHCTQYVCMHMQMQLFRERCHCDPAAINRRFDHLGVLCLAPGHLGSAQKMSWQFTFQFLDWFLNLLIRGSSSRLLQLMTVKHCTVKLYCLTRNMTLGQAQLEACSNCGFSLVEGIKSWSGNNSVLI